MYYKKIIAVFISLVLTLSVASPCFAEDYSSETSSEENLKDIYVQNIDAGYFDKLGDLDFDNNVTALDARIALRVSAKLAEISDDRVKYSDIDGDGKISAGDARKILRISAKLDAKEAKCIYDIKVGQTLHIDRILVSRSYFAWTHNDIDNLEILQTTESTTKEPKPGDGVYQNFAITAKKSGVYIVKFENKPVFDTLNTDDKILTIVINAVA